jgi:hypothetical protein
MGDPLEAELYYLHSLAISEEIGQTREMVETLFDIARARDAQGKRDDAALLTSLVLSHPASAQHSLFGHRHLQEEAKLLHKALEADLPTKVDERALLHDRSLDFEAVVGNLLQPEQRNNSGKKFQ